MTDFIWMSTLNLDPDIENIIGFCSNIHSVSEEPKLFVRPSPHLYTSTHIRSRQAVSSYYPLNFVGIGWRIQSVGCVRPSRPNADEKLLLARL
jgi:hypothetical protein